MIRLSERFILAKSITLYKILNLWNCNADGKNTTC